MKTLMRMAMAGVCVAIASATVAGQTTREDTPRPFEIVDNSFLVEEAINQEEAIFQNIYTSTRSRNSGWVGSFTQEWPVTGQRHQFSYTLPFAALDGAGGVGDVMLNYRFQLATEGDGVPAMSPRFSLVLPSGNKEGGLGTGKVGYQVNLPFSKQFGETYVHWNAGFTYTRGVATVNDRATSNTRPVSLMSPMVAASAIVRVRPMLNAMVEAVAAFNETPSGPGLTARQAAFTVSPGFRGGWNVGPRQVIVGAAVPVTFSAGQRDFGILTYFSYELPYRPVTLRETDSRE